MKRSAINDFIRRNYTKLSDHELAARCGITAEAVRWRRRAHQLHRDQTVVPRDPITEDLEAETKRKDRSAERSRLKHLASENERLQRDLDAAFSLRKVSSHVIKRSRVKGGEATMIALVSDTHVEEEVLAASVNGLNRYNLELARQRFDYLFLTILRLIEIEQQNTRVDNLILALLGDLITNANLHPELAHVCKLEPTEAIVFAQECVVSGIEHLLKNSKLNIHVVCHSGNHGRTTPDQRHATENGNSLEWLLYKNLASHFRNEPRLTFEISESYHSYVQVYDKVIRFHHGHDIRYGGGVGGITIPVRKAIAQWNTLKQAHIDCFGHFHQASDGGNFIANGSMIGYSAYALSVKAAFEEPTQMLFGIHSKFGKYITRYIKFV